MAERHHVRVAAPADVTLAAARDMNLQQSSVIRAIFKGRALLLGAIPDSGTHRSGRKPNVAPARGDAKSRLKKISMTRKTLWPQRAPR